MRKPLIVCLAVLLVGCGKEGSVGQEKGGRGVDSPRQFVLGHMGDVSYVVFSPDGRMLAAGSAERQFPAAGIVQVWDMATGRELATLRHPGETQTAGGGLSSSNNYIWSLAFSPDGKTLATGTTLGAKRWDVANWRELSKIPGYGEGLAEVSSVEFSPDGKTLATASLPGVKLWDVSTWQERATFSTGAPMAVTFSPNGKSVAVAERHNTLRLFDVATGQEQAAIHAEMGPLSGVAFSLDGNTVAAVGGGVKLWDVVRREGRTTLQERGTLQGHLAEVGRVAYCPDGKLLATASRSSKNGVVILWDVPTGQLRAILRDTKACAFSPDGRTLATGGLTTIDRAVVPVVKLWDLAEVTKPEVTAEQAKVAASEFITAVRDSGFEQAAGRALAAIVAQEAAAPVLVDGLKDPNVNVRTGIVFALRLIGPKAIPSLIKALKDEDAGVRVEAARAIGQIGPEAEAAVPAITAALKDEDARVRDAAASALRALKSARSHH